MTTFKLADAEKYFFCDPASAKGRLRRQRARQAIIGIAIDYLTRIFVIYAWGGRLPTSQLRDRIIELYDKYQPRRFGIESNAMQELFGDLVIDKAREQFGTTRIIGMPSPTKIEKDFKIRTTIEPVVNDGRLFILDSAIELRSELFGFPTAATRDMIDCLAMAIMLIPRRMPRQQQHDERDALADYLRKSGAPAHYIEQRLNEVQNANIPQTHRGEQRDARL